MGNKYKKYTSKFKPNRGCKSCNGKGWIVSPPVEYLCRECNGTGQS